MKVEDALLVMERYTTHMQQVVNATAVLARSNNDMINELSPYLALLSRYGAVKILDRLMVIATQHDAAKINITEGVTAMQADFYELCALLMQTVDK